MCDHCFCESIHIICDACLRVGHSYGSCAICGDNLRKIFKTAKEAKSSVIFLPVSLKAWFDRAYYCLWDYEKDGVEVIVVSQELYEKVLEKSQNGLSKTDVDAFVHLAKLGENTMRKQVEVFVDQDGKPQHLAVVNERQPFDKTQQYRTVCGSSGGIEVKKMNTSDVKLSCDDCKNQLELLKEI